MTQQAMVWDIFENTWVTPEYWEWANRRDSDSDSDFDYNVWCDTHSTHHGPCAEED